MIRVWHTEVLEANGPRLSSELGIVRLKGLDDVSRNVREISAGREMIWEQGRPYAPGSAAKGLMLGEISAYIACVSVLLDIPSWRYDEM